MALWAARSSVALAPALYHRDLWAMTTLRFCLSYPSARITDVHYHSQHLHLDPCEDLPVSLPTLLARPQQNPSHKWPLPNYCSQLGLMISVQGLGNPGNALLTSIICGSQTPEGLASYLSMYLQCYLGQDYSMPFMNLTDSRNNPTR